MSQNRRQSAIRRAQQQRGTAIVIAALLLVLLVIGCVRAISGRGGTPSDALTANPTPTVNPERYDGAAEDVPADQGDDADEGAAMTDDELADEQTVDQPNTADKALKKLPIIYRKKDEEKRICITIDDCFDAKYVRAVVALAEKYDADLTFFPKGSTIKENADLWKELYEKGYEIENHSYYHANVSGLDDEKLRKTIVYSEMALNEALGVNYHMRLFRCPTGDGMKDPRLHKLLGELGYEAVASWGLSGTQDAQKTLKQVRPGQLVLFHATEKDYERLKVVIPALAKKGYEMVSVNTLYGKGANEVTELDTYDH